MPGGLLNIISYGNQNIILNGNPSKTFFKTVYAKYSNFGIQKFQIDYTGLRNLQLNEESTFTFKIPRNADLILDTYLVFDLPNIWSPIIPPTNVNDNWKPYEFRWIDDIGTNIIKNVTLTIGGQIIQTYSGEYIKNMVERDFTQSKKEMFQKMTGMTPELTTPECAYNRINAYPNAFYVPPEPTKLYVGPEPSIRGRKIYVPLHFWFSFSSKMALPLVCLQYSEVQIDVTLRPVYDLFTINDTSLTMNEGFSLNKIRPNPNNEMHSLYRFLQPPPDVYLNSESYGNKNTTWAANIHLIVTYCFLSEEEVRVFAKNEQKYLIKDIKEDVYPNTVGTQKIKIYSSALASSWLWYFRRNDISKRNEWSNYSNWEYRNIIPHDVIEAPLTSNYNIQGLGNIAPYYKWDKLNTLNESEKSKLLSTLGPFYNLVKSELSNNEYIRTPTNLFINPILNDGNIKQIMTKLSILFDGKLRENELDSGIYNYIEKYKTSDGSSDDGLYTYNYTLHTNPFDLQPSGAINLSRFKTVELEFITITPPLDPNAESEIICDGTGLVIGNINPSSIYIYNYDLKFIEERYNVIRFISGQAGLVYAR